MFAGRRPKAAIFDLDGLLVDSEPLWHRAELEVFAGHGVPISLPMVLSTKGRFVGEVARHWYERFPWAGPGPDAVAAEVVEAVLAQFDQLALKPGARGALTVCLEAGMALAVASSSPGRLIQAALEVHGLVDAFEVVHSAEAESAGKPDPAVFLTTARLLGAAPAACLVVEDSPAGVEAAAAAAMACVAVPEFDVSPSPTLASFGRADLVLSSLERFGPWCLAVVAARRAGHR